MITTLQTNITVKDEGSPSSPNTSATTSTLTAKKMSLSWHLSLRGTPSG